MHAQRSIGTSAKLRNAEEVFEDDPDTTQEPGKDTTGVVDGVIGSLGELDKEELGTDVSELVNDLEEEEELAEEQDLAEDAELDAEGFVDGTDPIDEGDIGEKPIESELSGEALGEEESLISNAANGGDEDEIVFNQELDNESGSEVGVDQYVQNWNDLEEWREATSEHDKAFFTENGHTAVQAPNNTTGTFEGATVMPSAPPPGGSIAPSNGQPIPGNGGDVDFQPTWAPTSSPFSGNGGSIASEATWAPTASPDGGSSPTFALPTIAPVSPFPGNGGSSPTFGLPTRAPVQTIPSSSSTVTFAAYAILIFMPLLLICCCWRYCCKGRSEKDTRGEYRTVAAQYGNMGYDNTFSEVYSDDEDNGDLEDDSWGKSGRRTLEMSNLGNGHDEKLSMSEMNG